MNGTRYEAGATLADRLLKDMHHTARAVSVYLVNGFQMKGEVVEFDGESILLKLKDAHQLVMRSAVATMYPLPVSKGAADEWWRSYVPDSA